MPRPLLVALHGSQCTRWGKESGSLWRRDLCKPGRKEGASPFLIPPLPRCLETPPPPKTDLSPFQHLPLV